MSMKEWIKSLVLSATLLTIPAAEGRANGPNSNNSPKVKTAVGFVEDVIGKRIRALAVFHPHLEPEFSRAQAVFLTEQEDADLEWLKKSLFPLLEGCSISGGEILDNSQVLVNFGLPCGGKWTPRLKGVVVPLTHDSYPTGTLAFIPEVGGY